MEKISAEEYAYYYLMFVAHNFLDCHLYIFLGYIF